MSISAGSAMTTAGKCCGSATGPSPSARRRLGHGLGFPGGHGPTGAGLRPTVPGAVRSDPPALPTVTTFSRLTPLRPGVGGRRRPTPLIGGPSPGPCRGRQLAAGLAHPPVLARCNGWLDSVGSPHISCVVKPQGRLRDHYCRAYEACSPRRGDVGGCRPSAGVRWIQRHHRTHPECHRSQPRWWRRCGREER